MDLMDSCMDGRCGFHFVFSTVSVKLKDLQYYTLWINFNCYTDCTALVFVNKNFEPTPKNRNYIYPTRSWRATVFLIVHVLTIFNNIKFSIIYDLLNTINIYSFGSHYTIIFFNNQR